MLSLKRLIRLIRGKDRNESPTQAWTAPNQIPAERPPATPPAAPDDSPLLAHTEILGRQREPKGLAFSLGEAVAGKVRAPGRQGRDFLDGFLMDTLLRQADTLLTKRPAYVPVWDGFLVNPALERLTGRGWVLILRAEQPETAPAPALVARLRTLRAGGLRVALEDRIGTPWFQALAPEADLFALDSSRRAPGELRPLCARLMEDYPAQGWLAWNVATEEDFELLHRLGCEAFQGGFVTQRGDWSGNRLAPHSLRVARLIKQLREETETREIAEVLKQDLALTYRLLRYVNAAAWGINNPITSIEHALLVLGRLPLRRWLGLLLFGSARNSPGASTLMGMALTRARLMELLGQGRVTREEREQLFMLGLFSLIDVVLRVPLEQALQPVNLPESVCAALLKQEGPLAAYLIIAQAVERNDTTGLEAACAALDTCSEEINQLQIEALLWAEAGSMAETTLPPSP
ncbi:MAG: HDOD domain-containing protein [Rhodocyclaceae bacterium]|jgi:EAL and modified HD-GYP domain-containing signal transduction protein|nr:HDOD domain-containing protein [Rhodocyclaceae bacterium]